MYYSPHTDPQQYGVDLFSNIQFIKNETQLSKRYLFKCNSERILLEKFLTNEFLINKPKLIISINSKPTNNYFELSCQMNNLNENIENLISENDTWLISSGLETGIHNIIGKTLSEKRCLRNDDSLSLIGISTWKYIMENEQITPSYTKYIKCKDSNHDKFYLDNKCNIYFFSDADHYEKEISFYFDFERFLKKFDAFSLQIVCGGDRMNLELAYNYLQNSNIIVVLKGTGGIADLIVNIMQETFVNYIRIDDLVKQMTKNAFEIESMKEILLQMHDNYKNQILIYDLQDNSLRLDEKLFEVLRKKKFSMEILHENDINLNTACEILKDSYLVIIKNKKDGFTDLLEEILETDFINFDQVNTSMKNKINNQIPIENFEEIINEIRRFYKDKIIVYDLRELPQVSHDDLFRIMIEEETNRYKRITFSLIFNEGFLINSQLLKISNLTQLQRILKSVLQNNKLSLFKILLSKIKRIDKVFTNLDLIYLYEKSILIGSGHPLVLYKGLINCKSKYNPKLLKSKKSKKLTTYELESLKSCKNHKQAEEFITGTDLFFWALDSELFENARIIWEYSNDYVALALLGLIELKNKALMYTDEGFSLLSEKCLKESKYYESMSKAIFTEAYEKDSFRAIKCLLRPLKVHDGKSTLEIVLRENIFEFCLQTGLHGYLNTAWKNEELQTLNEKTINYRQKSKWANIQRSIQSPKMKYYFQLISYLVFLFIFTYFNMVELKTFNIQETRSVCVEVIIYLYIMAFTLEEIQQMCNQTEKDTFSKMKMYSKGLGNKFDMATLALSLVSISVRFYLHKKNLMIVRCLFAITLSLYFIKFMYFYQYIPSIGYKVIMIKRMIKDIYFFLAIFIIFILAYGTLIQSLQYPNSKLGFYLLKNIFYRPYFQVYGELMIESFEIPESCNTTSCTVQYSTILLGLAIFLLSSSILLINLLIAMFNYTFQKDVENKYIFLSIQLLQEYQKKSVLPPPLNILSFPNWVLHCICGKVNFYYQMNNQLVKSFNEKEIKTLSLFENCCAKSILLKSNSKNNLSSNEHTEMKVEMKKITEKLNQVEIKLNGLINHMEK